MFSRIAKNYDRANRIITLGMDVRWRTRAARMCVAQGNNLKIFDVATGTGDLAMAVSREAKRLGKRVSVTGLDFNDDMLRVARQKINRKGIDNIELVGGDALYTKLRDKSFDVVTCGFSMRGFDDLYKFLREMYRILKPGGRVVFLDVARPDSPLSGLLERYYMRVVPAIGAMYNKDAYVYLVSSIWKFDKERLAKLARQVGFKNVKITNLSLRIVYILTCTKPAKKEN
jgi:demethylmenaquinone methyltransferase/2-methoxy-6-polyprenyl-1,4-benzoquinol methylase